MEYKPLWTLTAWDKRFNEVPKDHQKKIINYPYVLANVFKEMEINNGEVRLLSTGTYVGYTTIEKAGKYLCNGEIVAIPWGGTPNVKYYNGKFVTADNRIATSLNTEILSNKFLYYYLQSKIDVITGFYRGSGIKHPYMNFVLNMEIPVPPFPVQEEIVNILDKFSNLTSDISTGLPAEIEARKKQYEYYRDKLLTFKKAS